MPTRSHRPADGPGPPPFRRAPHVVIAAALGEGIVNARPYAINDKAYPDVLATMLSATVTKLAWTDPRSTTASHSTAATAESSTGAVRQRAGDDQSQRRERRRHSGVSIADISGVMQGHEYCTSDPWSYGLSVLLHNDDSLAPFHPTPNGQAAIAAVVKGSLQSR